MNVYLQNILTYFDAVLHPAEGKDELRKSKRRASKPSYARQASPDSLNIRAGVRTQNQVRRNPAP